MRSQRFVGRRNSQIRLEPLEQRLCLAVTVTPVAIGGGNFRLDIIGDGADDDITINDNGAGIVAVTGTTVANPPENITQIRVRANGGSDDVIYNLNGLLTANHALDIALGAGILDTADVNLNGNVSDARFRLDIDGGPGVDEIDVDSGAVTDARLTMNLRGGADNDSITSVVGALTEARVDVYMDGGSGEDELSSTVGAIVDSYVNVSMHGGSANDLMSSTLGEVSADSYVTSYMDGDEGNDEMTTTLASIVDSHVEATMDGGSGDDTLTAVASGVDINENASLKLKLYGGSGIDGLTATYSGLLNGRLKFDADGGTGEDTIAAELTADLGSIGRLTAIAAGGKQVDIIDLDVIDNSGATTSTLESLKAVIVDPTGLDDTSGSFVTTSGGTPVPVEVVDRLSHHDNFGFHFSFGRLFGWFWRWF